MKKKGHRPITKVKNPEPKMDDPDWIIWAAWADRINFEEIENKSLGIKFNDTYYSNPKHENISQLYKFKKKISWI